MKIIVEGLVIPSLILALIYFMLSLYGIRGLLHLNKITQGLNTKKLFVMNCLLASFLRFLSFTSMAIFNYFEITISLEPGTSATDEDQSKLEQFFYKASIVQFDLPDFCFVSAYVLLLIVWAEAILQSRRHWLSSYSFRRTWILGYFFFNILLYTVQVSLYSLLFFPNVDQRLLGDFIYLTLTVISIGVPIVWLLCYLYLLIQFSGFPYLSTEARARLDYLNGLGSFWTFTRLIWGVLALTSVLNDWFDLTNRSVEFYSIALISIFVVCEVLPIIAGLRGSALSTLVVGATPAQSPDRPVSEAVRQVSHQSSYDGEDDAVSRAASSVYDHEMEDHYTALLPDDVKARDNAFFNGFYPRKLASRSSSHTNIHSNSVPSLPTSGRYSLREDLGLARTSSRRELQSNGNLSGRSYGELSDSGYRERRARLDQPPAQKSNFSVFLPWTWFEDE